MLLSILVLTLYFVIYGLVHSVLASMAVKDWIRRVFGPGSDRWYRLAYNLFAVVSLLPMLLLVVLLPDRTLYIVPAPWRWLMLGGQLLALVGLGVTLLQTDPWHFLGISQLFVGEPAGKNSLTTHGFYSWVRHPLYSFSLLLLWLTPLMSLNLLVTYLLFTLYFYIGSIYEEKRLVAEFGRRYNEYQQQVPRLVPVPGRRYSPTQSGQT